MQWPQLDPFSGKVSAFLNPIFQNRRCDPAGQRQQPSLPKVHLLFIPMTARPHNQDILSHNCGHLELFKFYSSSAHQQTARDPIIPGDTDQEQALHLADIR